MGQNNKNKEYLAPAVRINMCETMPSSDPLMTATGLFGLGYINMVSGYLKLKGYRYAEFLQAVGLKDNEWNERSLSLAEIIAFLDKAIYFTGESFLPLLAGRRIHITNFSDLGTLMMHCADVETVIKNTIYFHNLTSNGEFNLSVIQEGDKTYFRLYQNPQYSDEQLAPLIEMAMAAFANVTFFLAYGASIKDLGPAQINFRHNNLSDHEHYNKTFLIPVKFNHDFNQIVISSSFLKRPIYNANKDLYVLTKHHIEKQVAQWAQQLPVKKRIGALLIGGDLPQAISLKHIANQLDMSVSSLQRKLAQESTSYKDIKDSIILKLSNRLLENTKRSLMDIAVELGFSDTNSFSRTYKRLNNRTPLEFRNSCQS